MDFQELFRQIPDTSRFIEQLLGEAGCGQIKHKGDEISATCPSGTHADQHPSFSVNVREPNSLFNCFACDFTGNLITLVQHIRHCDGKTAVSLICKEFDIVDDTNRHGVAKPVQTIRQDEVDMFYRTLRSSKCAHIRKRIEEEWGIEDQNVLDDLEIGYSDKRERLSIPVRDADGAIKNIRFYSFDNKDAKMISYFTGSGENRLFPYKNLTHEEIWLCEGEKDAIVGISHGLNCVTMTAGAMSWNPSFNELFTKKIVNIVFDVDRAGQEGATIILNELKEFAAEVRIISLPVTKPKKDLTDFFVYSGGSSEQLKKLRDTTPIHTTETQETPVEIDSSKITKVSLAASSNAEYFHQMLETKAVVIGKLESPYQASKEVSCKCQMTTAIPACKNCPLKSPGGSYQYTFDTKHPDMLNFVDSNEVSRHRFIRNKIKYPEKCRVDIEDVSIQNIVELFLAPDIDTMTASADNQKFSNAKRTGYLIGDDIEANQSYVIRGYATPMPSNGSSVFVILEHEPIQDDINAFRMSSTIMKDLSIFQADGDENNLQAISNKLNDIYADFSDNVTHMIGRQEMHFAADLCYHSAINFSLSGISLKKGWVEIMMLGDTRTGKNDVVEGLRNHYRAGEMVNAENCSQAGLIGGLATAGNGRQFVNWGRLPVNDRRLLVLDEASGMSVDVISKLSRVRSAGIAEVTKINGNQSAMARTRMIWMANPKDGRVLKDREFPVEAIMGIMGATEDVARFEFVCFISQDDIPKNINVLSKRQRVPHKYVSEKCSKLVYWAWSRQPEQIEFTDAAEKMIYKVAADLTNRYVEDVPLIQKANFRIKLARMSVALAARLFSTDASGEKLIVQARHVAYVADFINIHYSSEACQYGAFSKQKRDERQINNEQELKDFFNKLEEFGLLERFCAQMQNSNATAFTAEQIGGLTGAADGKFNKTDKQIVAFLVSCNALESYYGKYKKTNVFVSWVKKNGPKKAGFSASSLMANLTEAEPLTDEEIRAAEGKDEDLRNR